MQRSLRGAHGLLETAERRLRPISPTGSSVRAAFSDTELVERSIECGLDRVHVCLHEDTAALGLIASFLLSHNWSIHLGSPAATWNTGPEAKARRDRTERNYCFLKHAQRNREIGLIRLNLEQREASRADADSEAFAAPERGRAARR